MGYVGPNGGGKSCAMVWDTIPSLEAGRPVLSTVRLLDYRNPRPCDDPTCESEDHHKHLAAHPLWIPWTSWTQLREAEKCDVLADEVTGVASSRSSQTMPQVIANQLVQLRRRDVVLRWTAPSWARADLIIRECTQGATFCTGFMSKEAHDEEGDRAWEDKRMFRWLTYNAIELPEDLKRHQVDDVKVEIRDLHWGPGSLAFSAYDTYDAVSTIGHVSDAGRCESCGGRRSPEPCSCPDYVGRKRTGRRGGGSPLAGSDPDGQPALVGVSASSSTADNGHGATIAGTSTGHGERAGAAIHRPSPTPIGSLMNPVEIGAVDANGTG